MRQVSARILYYEQDIYLYGMAKFIAGPDKLQSLRLLAESVLLQFRLSPVI